jgi:hypothetical protein
MPRLHGKSAFKSTPALTIALTPGSTSNRPLIRDEVGKIVERENVVAVALLGQK